MSSLVAALPMYDWPEARAETDAQWAAMRVAFCMAGIDAPEKLMRRNADLPAVAGGIRDFDGNVIAPDPAKLPPDELDLFVLWRHPKLLFSQTCWGPMETGLARHVRVIAQPDYSGFEGGEGELYSSAILMRGLGPSSGPSGHLLPVNGEKGEASALRPIPFSPFTGRRWPEGPDEGHAPAPGDGRALLPLELLRGKRFAFNSHDSMSGLIAICRDLEVAGESLGIFSERIETGSHRASARGVAEGRADAATIDCRTWDLVRRFEPEAAAALQVVGWTARRKGLPFVTSAALSDEKTVAAMRAVLSGGAFELSPHPLARRVE